MSRSFDSRIIPTTASEIWLCHHCEGTNINVAGTKYCGQCGKQVFKYENNGRERV